MWIAVPLFSKSTEDFNCFQIVSLSLLVLPLVTFPSVPDRCQDGGQGALGVETDNLKAEAGAVGIFEGFRHAVHLRTALESRLLVEA